VRGKAELIIVQQAHVTKAPALEHQRTGVILPIAGAEIERLSRLWEAYEDSLERIGFVRNGTGEIVVNAPQSQQVNVLDLDGVPEPLRQRFTDALQKHARSGRPLG
jgi:hypothetical protein